MDTTSQLPPTSLIVCSRNRPVLLVDTVMSVLEGDEVPSEIVIIDQSDQPNPKLAALETVQECEIRYVWTQTVGLSRANNQGIELSRHDIIAFTHDDVLVNAAWFGALCRSLLAAGQQGVVTGQVQAGAEQPGGFQLAIKTDEQPAVYTKPGDSDILYPLNMAMYKHPTKQIGLFDVRLGPGTPFPGAEDSDLAYRLLVSGFAIHYVPQAVVYHREWRSQSDYVALRWKYGLGRGAFYAKYLSLRNRYTTRRMSRDIRNHVLRAVFSVRQDRQRAMGDMALVGGIFYGAARWLLTHRSSSKNVA